MSGFRDGPSQPIGSTSLLHLLARVWSLFRPHRLQVLAVIATVLSSAALGTVNPLLIRLVFDRALFCGSNCPDLSLLDELVAIMVTVPIVMGVLGVYQAYLANRVGQRVMEDLRNNLYVHLQGMSLRFFTSTRTGEVQSRLSNDIGGIQTAVTDTATSILSNAVILGSTVVALTVVSWQLTIMSLALVPLFVLLTYRAGNARRRITAQTQKALAEMTALTEETLSVSGILLSKVFGRKREEIQRFRAETRRLADLAIHREMIGRVLFAVVGAFFSSAPALVYLLAGYMIAGTHANALSAGTIVAFTTLQIRLYFPIGQLLQLSVDVQGSLALFERIFEYLAMSHDIADHPDAVVIDPATARGDVEFDHVYFRYENAAALTASELPRPQSVQEGPWALEDISLTVKSGQLAAIVGPSGAGKTTLSYLVPRLYDVTEGTVRIDGIDARTMQLDSIASLVSMVTQETYLFHATVRRNLQYARPDASDEELEAAARSALIHERIMQLHDGYDTVVGERGYRMSGGEKQRIAIARVLLKAPRVLILDEATSALDSVSERLVHAALWPLMHGRTTIAIAHRLSTILAADVIFVLDTGRLVEQGTHAELVRAGGLYAQLYDERFQGGRVEAQSADGLVLRNDLDPTNGI